MRMIVRLGWEDSNNQLMTTTKEGGPIATAGKASSDSLDAKYLSLYEEKLSPFQLEQMDKHAFLHRLSLFERVLAFVVKNVMQDKWARNALMVYLLLVHVLALLYVLQVLFDELLVIVSSSKDLLGRC
jgi:hypothetical protein